MSTVQYAGPWKFRGSGNSITLPAAILPAVLISVERTSSTFRYLDVSVPSAQKLTSFQHVESVPTAGCACSRDYHEPVEPCPVFEGRRHADETAAEKRRVDVLLVEVQPGTNKQTCKFTIQPRRGFRTTDKTELATSGLSTETGPALGRGFVTGDGHDAAPSENETVCLREPCYFQFEH